jgi:hypothetical protein
MKNMKTNLIFGCVLYAVRNHYLHKKYKNYLLNYRCSQNKQIP